MSEAVRLARYRFAGSLRRSIGSALAIVVLVGAVGGAALASIVGARDTASSYTTFLARSNASDFSVTIPSAGLVPRFSRLPGVTQVTSSYAEVPAFPVSPTGKALFPPAYQNGTADPVGAPGREFFSVDRVAIVAGHRANPNDPRQFMATAEAERLMGWHLGQVVRFGFYTYDQLNTVTPGNFPKPLKVYSERLVATIVFNNDVVRDKIDNFPAAFLFTPAAVTGTQVGNIYVNYHLRVTGGYAGVARVQREMIRALPPRVTYNFDDYSAVVSKVDLTVRPESLALLVFGLLALVGTALTSVQLVARRLRERRDDSAILRALGAGPRAVAFDALAVPLAAVGLGAVLAVVVAIALSPLSVIGPVHAVLSEGVHAEWPVLAGGAGFIVVAAAAVATLLSYRWAPGRVVRGRGTPWSRVARWGRSSGLPIPIGVGLTFALEPGRGRTAVPVRSALVGIVAAVAMLSATLTFGSGFSTLISHPSLYGWNFDEAVTGGQDVPPQAVRLIAASPLVASWGSVDTFGNATIDSQQVPVMLVPPRSSWAPALIAGHEVENTGQIVLGAGTMAALHAHLGGTVLAGYGSKRDYPIYIAVRPLTIVGVATLPAIGRADTLHPSMGVGAVLDVNIEPPAMAKVIATPYPTLNGPALVAIRFRSAASRAARAAFLKRLITVSDAAFRAVPQGNGTGDAVFALRVQYPAQIISYRTAQSTPLILALVFSAGVVVAFGLTVAASARRRRRDLALFKSLGLRRRQLAATVAAQSTVSVAVGLVIGVPVGVVAGRWLWDLFANSIYAVPRATVPWAALGWLVLGGLVLANVVAFPPGRSAARTPVAELLRAE